MKKLLSKIYLISSDKILFSINKIKIKELLIYDF